MTMAERTFLTQDEEFNPAVKISEQVEIFLESLNLDTYNEIYVIRIIVDKVDPRAKPNTYDDEE